MHVWNVLHATRWKYRMQKLRKNSTIGEELDKQHYLLHMSLQYAELWPINGWDLWASLGTPANFDGFRVLASLLHRRRSTDINQTLHNVWPSPALVYYIYIFRGSCLPNGILTAVKFTSPPSLPISYIGIVTAWHLSSGYQPKFAVWYKEWNYGTFAECAICIQQGGHHVGHRPTF